MKHFFFGLFLLANLALRGQGSIITEDKPFSIDRSKDSAVLDLYIGLEGYRSLEDSEKEYLYWVNKMRINPAAFYSGYIQPFLRQFPEARSEEVDGLSRDMATYGVLSVLSPISKLNMASAQHASYLASRGKISHTGRGGSSFPERMKTVGVTGCAGEVIFDGKDDVLVGLILLLIDHGVPGLGHRKALLNPDFSHTGIAIRISGEQRTILVQDLACKQ